MDNKNIIETRVLKPTEKQAILDNIVKVNTPIEKSAVICVDGRTGNRKQNNELIKNQPYLQTLGGSLNMATVSWLLNGGQTSFLEQIDNTFSDLSTAGYTLSVHTGHHGNINPDGTCDEKSDCGFADNQKAIIAKLQTEHAQIWEILKNVANTNNIQLDKQSWDSLIDLVINADLSKIPSGGNIINQAQIHEDVIVQHLEGEHQEIAALLNLKPNTTLDTDNNQATQAFNLDAWYVIKQAKDLVINKNDALLLSLGLYIATEMVLVEDKKRVRLPIVVNQ